MPVAYPEPYLLTILIQQVPGHPLLVSHHISHQPIPRPKHFRVHLLGVGVRGHLPRGELHRERLARGSLCRHPNRRNVPFPHGESYNQVTVNETGGALIVLFAGCEEFF